VRVLSVVHDPSHTGGGGLFETVAEERGHRHERWVAPDGPHDADPAAYDAIMVFGGAMHPDQDAEHPWLPVEAEFIRGALDERVPLLGVCLGSQLIARAAGAGVRPAAAPEVGWHAVELTGAGRDDPLIGVLPDRVDAFQWHYYTFGLPAGATLLATSAVSDQAFRIGDHAWAMQFHAEVTREMVETWLAEGEQELPKPRPEVQADTDRLIGAWNGHGRALCEAFLELAAARTARDASRPAAVP
jgi:GMP synthase-like glutamine amidotransferase